MQCSAERVARIGSIVLPFPRCRREEAEVGGTTRFGVSMDRELVVLLDRLAASAGYHNRSEALRSLVRREVIRAGDEDGGRQVAGIITLIYRYTTRLTSAPVDEFPSIRISANLQLHLEKDICMKLLVIQGRSGDVHEWAKKLTAQRGVVGRLTISATDDIIRELEA
jgi:CopG family transcriptional regulator, nickel-responsive regulator